MQRKTYATLCQQLQRLSDTGQEQGLCMQHLAEVDVEAEANLNVQHVHA